MKLPKSLERAFYLFPALQGLWIAFDLLNFIRIPGPWTLARLIFSSYLVSPLLWQACRATFDQKEEGIFRIGNKEKSSNLWLVYYNLQIFYTHFPFFERALKLVPGAYSAWLRLWGSKIGKKVNWTPQSQVLDRGHMNIGDRAFFGHQALLAAHAVKKVKSSYLLFVKRVTIGADAMISYDVTIGPGSRVGSRTFLEACAKVYPNTHIPDGTHYANL